MTFNDNAQLDTSQASGGGGGGMRPGGIAVGGGAGGILLLIVFVLMQLFGGGGGGGVGSGAFDPSNVAAAQGAEVNTDFSQCKTGADANRDDACRVIGTTNALQSFWASQNGIGAKYRQIKTVIFTGAVNTGCGQATSDVGPFYCPLDERVYIDTNFYNQLKQQLGAQGGDLAKSYVIAHEYGHHISNIAGVLGRAQQDPKGPESGAVRTELQADCYAGVWMNHITEAKDANGTALFKPLTEAQVLDAQNAASTIGDDTIQKKMQGRVTPENFTHGTSAQRQKWLMQGFKTGDPAQCNTFDAADLG